MAPIHFVTLIVPVRQFIGALTTGSEFRDQDLIGVASNADPENRVTCMMSHEIDDPNPVMRTCQPAARLKTPAEMLFATSNP
jgi:hypothetical protein